MIVVLLNSRMKLQKWPELACLSLGTFFYFFMLMKIFWFQGLLQNVSQNSLLQYNEIHIQHGNDDERESKHALFVSNEIEYGTLC